MATVFDAEAYQLAQQSVALMKAAIAKTLANHPAGLKNAQIGRLLGVNADSIKDQDGWFQWTVLKFMEAEGTVTQTKERGPWVLVASLSEIK